MGAKFAFSIGQRKHVVAGANASDPSTDMEIIVKAGVTKHQLVMMIDEARQQILEADDDYDL